GIAVLRMSEPRQEKIIWTTLLAGALLMPVLVRWSFLPALPIKSFSVPTLGIHGFSTGGVPFRHVEFVSTAYISVSLLLLLRLPCAAVRMWQMVARARPIRELWTLGLDVRVTGELLNPASFGRTILLPLSHESWTEAKRSIILQHEQAHVRHHDSQIQWLAGLHACLFWFSPLAWWLRRRLAPLARDGSADHGLRGDVPKVDYATVLLEEAQMAPAGSLSARRARLGAPASSMLVSIASRGLEARVDRILSMSQPAKLPSKFRRALAALS